MKRIITAVLCLLFTLVADAFCDGFSSGFTPGISNAIERESQFVPKSSIYVSSVNTPRYSGPVVANTIDEPNRASLLTAANGRIGGGFTPNLVSSKEILKTLQEQYARNSVYNQAAAGRFYFG